MTNKDSEYTDDFWVSRAFPWKNLLWVMDNLELLKELSPRPSKTKPGFVAYYQTPEKRERGLLTTIKPGRFLRKYFVTKEVRERNTPAWIEEVIKREGLAWAAAFKPLELHITQDADEIEDVYKSNKLGSCMWFGDGGYKGHCHPARVYGGNLDLGIAYIGERTDCRGRCLVWPEKKIYFTKMYGDENRLKVALHAAGYQAGYSDDFEGARLLCIPDENTHSFIMPYLDVIGEVDHQFDAASGKEVFIITECGDYEAREQSGLLKPCERECGHCCTDVDEDHMTWVEGIEDYVCRDCLEEHYFCCEVMEEYYHNDDRVDTEEHRYLSREGLGNNDAFYWCEWSELYLHIDDHHIVETAAGEYVSQRLLEEQDYWHCQCSYLWYSPDDAYVAHIRNPHTPYPSYKVSKDWIEKNIDKYREYLKKEDLKPIVEDMELTQAA